jgi:Calcineurin-like phosphoesterase
MISKRLIFSLFLAIPFLGVAGEPFEDNSKAGTDGPYVFYRGNGIVVKSVVTRDSQALSSTKTYSDKSMVALSCQGPEATDVFSFQLKKRLENEPTRYELPARMLVLSDIEGNFAAFKTMLLGAKVIDKNFNWIFQDGHVVLLGDFFDRGLNVTESLWLIYKLETEAEAAGGKVHFILGNHEVLNLQGCSQYARKKYLENAKIINEPFSRLYDNNSEMGRWLRTKNAVELIGDYVFCHGGISPKLADTKLSLEEINHISRQNLGKENKDILNKDAQLIFDLKIGIFWYRGAAKNSLAVTEISRILEFAQAKRMVIGHTLQAEVTAHYSGNIICIDLYHEENLRQGFMKTLWIEDGYSYILDSKGEKSSVFNITFFPKTGITTSTSGN